MGLRSLPMTPNPLRLILKGLKWIAIELAVYFIVRAWNPGQSNNNSTITRCLDPTEGLCGGSSMSRPR